MLGLFLYSAAIGCVRGGLGRLLDPPVWDQLLAGNNQGEMISILSTTAYRDVVVEAPHDDPQALEIRLRGAIAARMRLPLPFLRGAAGRLIDRLWRKFEVDNLVIVLRAHHGSETGRRDGVSLVDLGPASRLDWQELGNARSVAVVIDRILSGPLRLEYGRALQNGLNEYRRRSAVFLLEISLQLDYYRKLWRNVELLLGRDRRAARRLIGTMIDFRNLHWAYRYRIFFDMAPESVLSYTLPQGGRVDVEVIRRIATGAPLKEILAELWGRTLPGLERLEEMDDREAVVELEVVFRRFLYREAGRMLLGYPLHLGAVLAYVVLLEAEVDDLIAVLEARLIGWPAERIRPRLIGERGR